MRLEIQKAVLQKSLSTVMRGPTTRVNPILNNIKIEINQEGARLTYSSEAFAATHFIKNENILSSNDGGVLIEAKTLNDVIRAFSGSTVVIETFEGTTTLVSDGISEYKLPTMNIVEYPDFDFNPFENAVTLNSKVFTKLIDQTSFAAGLNDKRPLFMALNLKLENQKLTAIAADVTRIAKKSIDVESKQSFNVNPDAKHINDAVKVLEDSKEFVLSTDGRIILICTENTKIRIKLIPGDYPIAQITNIITKFNNSNSITLETATAIQRIASVIALNDNDESKVKMILKKNLVEFQTRNSLGGAASSKIEEAEYDDQNFDIHFNAVHVLQALRVLDGKFITFSFQGELKPFSIVSESDGVTFVMTPLRVV